MKPVIRKINNLSLYKKIILIIVVSILCIYLIFLLSIRYMNNTYEKALYETNAAMLNQVSASLESKMGEIETISYNILINSTLQDQLMELFYTTWDNRSAITKRDIYTILNAYTFYNTYIESINLLLPSGELVCVGSSSDIERFDSADLSEGLLAANGNVIWSSAREAGNLVSCGRAIRQIKYLDLSQLASLYIIVNMESMIDDALKDSGFTPADSSFVLYAGDNRIFPKTEYYDELSHKFRVESISDANTYRIETLDTERKFIIHGALNTYGWDYLFFRDYDTIFHRMQMTKTVVLVISVLFCVFSLILIRFFIRKLMRHIEFLTVKIKCFGAGKQIPDNIADYTKRSDEIGQLHQNFDAMTKNVINLRDENYDKQILLKDTTIKMLQQQINPHFLYNTLDTINWLAQKYGADDISMITGSLGRLFRASISSQGEIIPLSEELTILNSYITIQKIRFGDRLTFTLVVPDEVGTFYVPKLCIQPLVENALKYSLDYSDEHCYIYVTIKSTDEKYIIEVSNTGSQFEADILNKIKEEKIVPQGSGIGLVNIDTRLKLLYGDKYGLHISNKEGMATVMLIIPKEKNEEAIK